MLHPRDHAAFPNYSWRKVERSPCHSPPRSRYRRTIVRMADKTGPPVLKGTLIVSISPKGQKAKIFLFYEVPSKMHFFKKSVDSYFQVGGPCQCWPSVVGYMGVCIYIYILWVVELGIIQGMNIFAGALAPFSRKWDDTLLLQEGLCLCCVHGVGQPNTYIQRPQKWKPGI